MSPALLSACASSGTGISVPDDKPGLILIIESADWVSDTRTPLALEAVGFPGHRLGYEITKSGIEWTVAVKAVPIQENLVLNCRGRFLIPAGSDALPEDVPEESFRFRVEKQNPEKPEVRDVPSLVLRLDTRGSSVKGPIDGRYTVLSDPDLQRIAERYEIDALGYGKIASQVRSSKQAHPWGTKIDVSVQVLAGNDRAWSDPDDPTRGERLIWTTPNPYTTVRASRLTGDPEGFYRENFTEIPIVLAADVMELMLQYPVDTYQVLFKCRLVGYESAEMLDDSSGARELNRWVGNVKRDQVIKALGGSE
ncbi:MAG: hypothetical protein CMJ34_01925 [Phycisphaerae bacterium]|nr:hypothetical protein [Phycisphaerae bacterium]